MTPAEARAALLELGTTPDEVADSLRRLGVRGHREECTNCPIAVYLHQRGARDAWVEWSTEEPPGVVRVDGEPVDAPACVLDFAYSFDSWAYDDLDAQASP